ncbi:hypothetical protein AVEN_238823-1 [Araneus ventricosus]|uniref:Uncharacterized protein n=1 Tax=Araneus ventricosus TaxID=182803 RepID=A0A4Y2VNE0_ARAVE|nr:hypothetical protein AVEN_238823-1 [Araneus ventricosus]
MMERWQKEWEEGETSRLIFNIIPYVKTRLSPRRREEIIFFSLTTVHLEPTLKDLKWHHPCTAAVKELAPNATKCLLTESRYLKRLNLQLEKLWFQAVASNQLSGNNIFNIIRLIHRNVKTFTPY